MIAAGYEDGNDAGALRHDPAFKLALDRLPDAAALCSQPTISRIMGSAAVAAVGGRASIEGTGRVAAFLLLPSGMRSARIITRALRRHA